MLLLLLPILCLFCFFFFFTLTEQRVIPSMLTTTAEFHSPDKWIVGAVLKETITGPADTPTFRLQSFLAWPTCSLLFPIHFRWLQCQRKKGLQKKAKKSQEKVVQCNTSITNSCSSSSEEHQEGVLKCFHFAHFSSVNHTSPQHSLSTPSLL